LSFVLLFLIGLIVGSFANVVIYRLPRGEQFISGRSHCPVCGHAIAWYDLLPVFSFLILGGHCRYCGGKISTVYPIVEICSGLIWLFSFWLLRPAGIIQWLFWVFILELFLILAFIDLKHFILADSIMAVILAAVACYEIFGGQAAGMNSIFSLGNLISALALFFVFFLIWVFSGGKGVGLGDAKLAGLMGLVFGFWNSVVILYLAIIIGVLVGAAIILMHRGNLKTRLPFGAFASFSAIFFVLLGRGIPEKAAGFFRYLLFKADLF